MTKELKMLLWWSFFIAVYATVYAIVFNLAGLNDPPIMWASYVPLALFFMSGAQLKDIPGQTICTVMGFFWGVFCLWMIPLFGGGYVGLGLGVFISVLACCVVHFAYGSNTIIRYTPTCFGGFAVCFAVGGGSDIFAAAVGQPTAVGTCIAMVLGLALGVLMAIAGGWAKKIAGIEA